MKSGQTIKRPSSLEKAERRGKEVSAWMFENVLEGMTAFCLFVSLMVAFTLNIFHSCKPQDRILYEMKPSLGNKTEGLGHMPFLSTIDSPPSLFYSLSRGTEWDQGHWTLVFCIQMVDMMDPSKGSRWCALEMIYTPAKASKRQLKRKLHRTWNTCKFILS